jgi:hypothetical protein
MLAFCVFALRLAVEVVPALLATAAAFGDPAVRTRADRGFGIFAMLAFAVLALRLAVGAVPAPSAAIVAADCDFARGLVALRLAGLCAILLVGVFAWRLAVGAIPALRATFAAICDLTCASIARQGFGGLAMLAFAVGAGRGAVASPVPLGAGGAAFGLARILVANGVFGIPANDVVIRIRA